MKITTPSLPLQYLDDVSLVSSAQQLRLVDISGHSRTRSQRSTPVSHNPETCQRSTLQHAPSTADGTGFPWLNTRASSGVNFVPLPACHQNGSYLQRPMRPANCQYRGRSNPGRPMRRIDSEPPICTATQIRSAATQWSSHSKEMAVSTGVRSAHSTSSRSSGHATSVTRVYTTSKPSRS